MNLHQSLVDFLEPIWRASAKPTTSTSQVLGRTLLSKSCPPRPRFNVSFSVTQTDAPSSDVRQADSPDQGTFSRLSSPDNITITLVNMCRSFSVHFLCTPTNPNHKLCYKQSCQQSRLAKFLERSRVDPEALRGYTLHAKRLCPECDPEKRPVPEPSGLCKGDRHVLSTEEGMKEMLELEGWARSL